MARTPKAQVPGEYIPAAAPLTQFERDVAKAYVESWNSDEDIRAIIDRLRRTNLVKYVELLPYMAGLLARAQKESTPTSSVRVLSAVPRTTLDGPPRDA